MQVRDLRASEIEAARRFLCAQGWAHRVGSESEFSALIANSQRTAVAVTPEDRIVGFARGVTDGLANGYLSMVCVSPEYQRKGIGRTLVQHIMGDNPRVTWVLRAERDGAKEFFSRLGFGVSATAMERLRR